MTRATAFVVACVRGWTRIYTWRLPSALRDARCEEIESDLWESLHDAERRDAPLLIQMTMRLALGIPDDVAWRLSHVTVNTVVRTAIAAAAVCTLLFVAALTRVRTNVVNVPARPLPVHVHKKMPDPPPPPPPPAGTRAQAQPFEYGRTSYAIVTDGPVPVATKQVRPIYPPVAVAARLEGEVLIQARIAEDGCVTDAEAAPIGVLARSAIRAIQQWEFTATEHASREPALLTVRVTFGRSQ